MTPHLEGVVVCISGDPRDDKDKNPTIRQQFTDENVSNWLRYRGGSLVEEVNEATTHLICSRAAFSNKKNPKVKSARKHGCHIVTYEWLTDTIQLWDYQKRNAPPDLYHPGEPRDGNAISDLYYKKEKKKRKASEQVPLGTVNSTTMDGDDGGGASAAEPTVGTGMEGQKIIGDKGLPSASASDKKQIEMAFDDKDKASIPANKERSKLPGKPKTCAESRTEDPAVDLNLFVVSRGKTGLYSIEVSKPGKLESPQGSRWMLELFESEAEPKKYLFRAREYMTEGSGICRSYFPSKAPGDKKNELAEFRNFFQQRTGVDWHQRDEVPSTGPFYYQPPGALAKAIGSTSHKDGFDQLEGSKGRSSTSSGVVFRKPCDRKISLRRKRSCSEGECHARACKALELSKPSVAVDSAKATDCGYRTA
ncbi:hypothetical protein diail_9169 [Diaporthe ilicicola]|nr:hypothetical protein diail_9169 [Diaporthe ilicicola]